MLSVGVKELKAKLSSYIDQVNRGDRVIITEHGREVALLIPITKERRAISSLVESGRVHWAGGKPRGLHGIKLKRRMLSDTVLEERR